jgi:nicotinamidase-related amidase
MKVATLRVAILAIVCGMGMAHAQDATESWSSIKALPAPPLKSITLDPHTTALVVMDFDSKICTPTKRARCYAAIPKVASLVAMARQHGVLVLNFFNASMKQDDIVAALKPAAGETVEQGAPDKFYLTNLEKTLRDHHIETLVLAGTSANGTVLATALGAAERKFKIVVPVDTMPADGPWQEQFSIWEIANGPGLRDRATMTRSDMLTF